MVDVHRHVSYISDIGTIQINAETIDKRRPDEFWILFRAKDDVEGHVIVSGLHIETDIQLGGVVMPEMIRPRSSDRVQQQLLGGRRWNAVRAGETGRCI